MNDQVIDELTEIGTDIQRSLNVLRGTRNLLEQATEDIDMADIPQVLRDAASRLRTAVDAAKARVADNPELSALAAELDAISGVADTIDPDVPTDGGVNEGDLPAEGGEQPAQ